MSEITITLTEQQEKFLKMFAANHGPNSEDNVCTHKPIHTVQTQRERVVDPDYSDVDCIKYYVPDFTEAYDTPEELVKAYYEYNDEECPIAIVTHKEAYDQERFIDIDGEEQVVFGVKDYFEAYGIPKDFYTECHIEKYYEDAARFFILAEAKRYIEYQGHNLCNPRTYTYGPGYANHGDYESFWDLLYGMGKMLNENN